MNGKGAFKSLYKAIDLVPSHSIRVKKRAIQPYSHMIYIHSEESEKERSVQQVSQTLEGQMRVHHKEEYRSYERHALDVADIRSVAHIRL